MSPRLTPSLQRKIVKAIEQGVPTEIAARKVGVPLGTFADWMTKKGRKYKMLQQAVDRAEAVAVSEYVAMVRRAGKRGKAGAAFRWLQARASAYFPPATRLALTLNQNTTLLAQIKAVQEAAATAVDPRELLEREMLERPQAQALPQVEERELQTPAALSFEPNVISDLTPGVIEMIRTLPDRVSRS